MRRLAIAAVIAQAGIAVTGSIVRVTGSGLGCPTWPQCFPGSLVPTPHPEVAALHQWVEFGNRLLTFAVVAVAGLCFLAALGHPPAPSAAGPAGPGAAARRGRAGGDRRVHRAARRSCGGASACTSSSRWCSCGSRWCSSPRSDEGDGPPRPVVPRAVRALVGTSTAVLAALLLAGTFVTAAGPHSGDADTPRLAAGVPAMAQLHADLLFGYLGLLVGLGFALRAVTAPAGLLRRYAVLVAAVLLQGVVGGVQYALGVPEALASLHVLGAALVTVAAAAVWTGTAPRGPAEARPTPPRPGDATPAEPPPPRGATSPDVADRPALAERS